MGDDLRRRREAHHRAARSPRSPRPRHHHQRQELPNATATTTVHATRTTRRRTRFVRATVEGRGGHPVRLPREHRTDQRDDKETEKSVEPSRPGWVISKRPTGSISERRKQAIWALLAPAQCRRPEFRKFVRL